LLARRANCLRLDTTPEADRLPRWRYYLRLSDRRIRDCLGALTDNDDALTTQAADALLGRS
jgi:hypothetical protein